MPKITHSPTQNNEAGRRQRAEHLIKEFKNIPPDKEITSENAPALYELWTKETEELKEIEKHENPQERRELVHAYIDKVLGDCDSEMVDEAYYEFTLRRLLKARMFVSYDDLDRSWSQEQVNALLRNYEKFIKKDNLSRKHDEPNLFPAQREIFWMLSTSGKYESDEDDTVSELVAKYIMMRLKEDEPISLPLQMQLVVWLQDVQMIEKNVRFDLLVQLMNKREATARHLAREMVANIGFYGSALLQNAQDYLEKNQYNMNSVLKILEFFLVS